MERKKKEDGICSTGNGKARRGKLYMTDLREKDKEEMKPLTNLNQDESSNIQTITGDSRFISRITSIGLSVGSTVRIVRQGWGLPMLLYAHDTLIAVSKKEAEKIFVTQKEGRP